LQIRHIVSPVFKCFVLSPSADQVSSATKFVSLPPDNA
jgi:hypothetical protein